MSLTIRDLEFTYSKKVDFHLRIPDVTFAKGSLNFVIGPNGSGKTTLGKIIAGLLKPQKGFVELDGERLSVKKVSKIAEDVGYSFQNPSSQLFAKTVEKEILLGTTAKKRPNDHIGEKLEQLLEDFGLIKYRDQHPRCLSRGERQKVVFCSILIKDPRVLILDEPFSGIDMVHKEAMLLLLRNLRKTGKIILLMTHELDLALEYSDNVIGFQEGRIALNENKQTFPMSFSSIEEELGLPLPPSAILLQAIHNQGIVSGIKTISDLDEWYSAKTSGKFILQ